MENNGTVSENLTTIKIDAVKNYDTHTNDILTKYSTQRKWRKLQFLQMELYNSN